jgi:hypothetical protein
MEMELQIPQANLTRRSALPVSPSITTNPAPSFEIHNTMAVGHREIFRLRLQMWAAELVAELVAGLFAGTSFA